MKNKVLSTVAIVLAGLLWGCYPGGADYAEELDVAYTNYAKGYDFQSKGTYSLPDQIVKITGDTSKHEFVKDKYAVPILTQIRANMTNLGWTEVAVDANPDLELLPAAWSTTTLVSGGYWGSYWCWYYYYYCGGGWYYPYPVVYSYSTGSLVMTLIDHNPDDESTDGSRQVVWTGAINGLLSGSYNKDRVNKGIDQTFKQSPYLKTN